jgi:hypothetical protein
VQPLTTAMIKARPTHFHSGRERFQRR